MLGQNAMAETFFTLTAGRTGSAWLAELFSLNLPIHAVHEPLDIDDFGRTMPDIRTMRTFNTFGNNAVVREFWARKFEATPPGTYVETNHALGKCGLFENLVASPRGKDATVIILRRDIVKQCLSYVSRADFSNVTVIWQWYLHPKYPKNLVTAAPFDAMGAFGASLWYCYEMAARQAYYHQLYRDRINMVDARLEDITKPEGAQAFWASLGFETPCVLPPPANATKGKQDDALRDQIETLTAQIAFDADEIAAAAIRRGFTFEAA